MALTEITKNGISLLHPLLMIILFITVKRLQK